MARRCEALGYHRFWVAEHHNSASFVGCAPEVLLGALTQATTRMRLGAGAVQLPHYAPYKVAEQFAVLDALAPGRIDLGFGKSPGEPFVREALRGDGEPRDFMESVRDTLAYLGEGIDHSGTCVRAFPTGSRVTGWMMGGSVPAALDAAALGLPYCHNYSDRSGTAQDSIAAYRAAFVPGVERATPYAAALVWVLVAPDEDEAQYHFAPRRYWRAMLAQGRRDAAVSPATALAYRYSAEEQAMIDARAADSFVGATGPVAERLQTLARSLAVDELVIVGWTYDEAARQRSYALLADALIQGRG